MVNSYQLWRLENALKPGQINQGFDRVYIPQVGYDGKAHDVAIDDTGVLFVYTLFSCLARPCDKYSFIPLWKPQHISRLTPEGRCHLNGLAITDDNPRYVTCVSQTDANENWRDFLKKGKVVIDVQSNEIVAEGLSMSHSPRWHNGKLWVLNSGE